MRIVGAGTVRRTSKASWQIVFSLGKDPITGKYRQATRTVQGNKSQAYKAREEFRHEIESGLKVDADKVTFGEYARLWQEQREASGSLAVSTTERDKCSLKHLYKYLQEVALRDIDTGTVRNLYLRFSADKMGKVQANRTARVFSQILKQAVNDDIIMRNPCDRVPKPSAPKEKQTSSLDREGFTRLLDALKLSENEEETTKSRPKECRYPSRVAHATAARIALGTGMRRGEILGLMWSDVDLEKRFISVTHSLCKVSGELKSTKTTSSVRDIAIDLLTASELARWKVTQAEYLLTLGIAQKPSTPVITNEIGGFIAGDNYGRWWRAFCKRYGFEGLRFHDLRHTHATLLVSSGLNIKAISKRLGHSKTSTTLDLYAHAQREDDEKAADIIGQIVASEPPKMGEVIGL